MGQIWASPDSRSIFYFLVLNLCFCGVEFGYGILTNSLGLISDAFHMLFDCTALVMGLVASVMSRYLFARTTMGQIWASPDSRSIFYFLVLNLCFCGVEFGYGILTNSLGLISDAFHVLFDCTALVMGLVASVMSRYLFARTTMGQIWASSDSRSIFYFLVLNLGFCGVEFGYGILTNSLGLISDAFHMLFDCTALVMGLVASVMSRYLFARTTMGQIWASPDSRSIFYFLVLNLCFCGVEFGYGILTNSLGLISDAFHMLFDCTALVMGLVASVMFRCLFARTTMGQIWASPDSRSIFYFLVLNLCFCGVEFGYGIVTNSLGLISDAFHMLFDCTALVMGLVASVMSRYLFARTTMGQIWASPDSRSIFCFLVLNLCFCGVEFGYGILTNSLCLISDAFHMLFDCTALVMGLVASVMSRYLFARTTMGQIWASPDSRSIFYFLVLKLCLCGVEFGYGILTNSLGLISDAFHMLFDCTALVMGLVASVMSRYLFARTTMGQIWASPDSRSIFYFLVLNLCFCGVEFGYGILTNSLGLISDAFRMLFDCTALVMGLVASVMSRYLFARTTMGQIWASPDSRSIFYFLVLNLGFCGVEFGYGILTNSLGLISDAFHMLFDCTALVMGLVASVLSRYLFARTTMGQIWASPDSRSIFYFLVLNLCFCGVEFGYGILTNSLGLISDAFHMLFDCTALVMGLVASVMSRYLFARTTMGQIWASPDSRSIFYFLVLNLCLYGVEFGYGILTNSLGLISDAFHMLFDCTALVMGLVASVMSRWRATGGFSYGYGRVEVLSGFINALFLVVISFFILVEALQRLYDPPHIHAEKLFVVSVMGLLINFFGLWALGHNHSHGGGGDHGHSHGGADHGHSHGGGNANMKGVYLHILADTGGSVAVILSSIVIHYLGWHWVDPFCSLLLATLIFVSTLPLLKESVATINQKHPDDIMEPFQKGRGCRRVVLKGMLEKVLHVEGVTSYSDAHCWELKSGSFVASIRVQVTQDSSEQAILGAVSALFRQLEIKETCVQVEKEAFFNAIPSLLPSYPLPQRVSKKALSDALFVRAM